VHQANERILSAVAERLDIPVERFLKTIHIYANTSAATIPTTLAYHLNDSLSPRKILRGDIIAFEALGGGLTWGGAILKY
jgi:3-oxoacyl-[acyl-carrier-protein] synthase-3